MRTKQPYIRSSTYLLSLLPSLISNVVHCRFVSGPSPSGAGQVDMYRGGSKSGARRLSGPAVLEEDGDEGSIFSVTTEEKRNVEVNMKLHSEQQPVVGGIYRDKTGSSLVVVNIIGGKVLLEYANGTVTSVDAGNWHQLCPQISVY